MKIERIDGNDGREDDGRVRFEDIPVGDYPFRLLMKKELYLRIKAKKGYCAIGISGPCAGQLCSFQGGTLVTPLPHAVIRY